MAIGFSKISSTARTPLFHVEFDSSQAGISQARPRVLAIGVPLNALATVPAYVPSAAKGDSMCESPSQLAQMLRAIIDNYPAGEVWMLPVFAGTDATSAAGSIAFTGTAGTAETLGIYIGGKRVTASIAVGDTASAIATKVSAAINAATSDIFNYTPVYATGTSSGTVSLTSRVEGTLGNSVDVRLNYGGLMAGEALPSGVSAVITAMHGGTGAADLSGVAAALGSSAFDTIIHPFSDTASLATLQGIMDDDSGRWSDTQQLFGHTWTTKNDTSTNLLTLGAARNNPHETIAGLYNSPTLPWVIAGALGGQAAQSLDADAARTLQTLTLKDVLAPAEADWFNPSEIEALLHSGIATLAPQRDGSVQILRAITTYQTNKWGSPDAAYLDSETLYNLQYVVRDLRSFVTTTYPRAKLANNNTPIGAGSPVITPNSMKAALVSRYSQLVAAGMAQDTAAFKAGLVCEINASDPNRLDVLYDPILMGNLRIFAALTQFRLAA